MEYDMRSGILLMAGVIALAGCQSRQLDTSEPATADAQPAIHGHAIYRERIVAPPGALLTVQLIDNQREDTVEAVVAITQVHDAKGPPFAFALPYEAEKLQKDGSYSLHASLRDADGVLWFATDTRAPVVPGSGDPVELRMVRVSSPWDDAKSRGIGFRGIGTEPGWLVEIDHGESPALHAELDYGERKIDIARTEAFASGFRGTSADGTNVSLKIVKEACNDGMSDTTYPASTVLTVGDQTYHGCGRFLFD
jgi:uncharacterized lipoprotein YbaY